MTNVIQLEYETCVDRFLSVIHGADGLGSLVTVYHLLLEQYRQKGQRLWDIEPLLFIFIKSLETNLYISLGRLLEPKDRSHGNLQKFFSFCKANASKIKWIDGELTITLIDEQEAELERHRETIEHIKSRRDKGFAHFDRTYFEDEDKALKDFSVTEDDMVSLANCIIRLLGVHDKELRPNRTRISLHIASDMMVDDMIRNLEAGRKVNALKRRKGK
jgi:hypothetical protein